MEMNAESVLDALNDFERKPSEIQPILEDYLLRIAQNGEIIFPWSKLKPLLKRKLEIVLDEFYETCPVEIAVPVPNFQTFNYDTLKKIILSAVESFNSAPFTIQRICELITNPKKHYNRTDKYMRGIEKNVLVVSTIEPRIGVQNDANANVNPIVNGMIGDSPHGDNDCFNGHENNENEPSNNLNSPSNHVLLDNFANVFPSAACIPSPSNICINRDVETISRVIESNFLPTSECIETQEVGLEAPVSMDSETSVDETKEELMDTESEASETPSGDSSKEELKEQTSEPEALDLEVEPSEIVETEIEKSEPCAEEPEETSKVEQKESFENDIVETEIITPTDDAVESDISAIDTVESKADSMLTESSPAEPESVIIDNKSLELEQCQQDDTVSQSDDSISNDSSEVSQSDEASNEACESAPIEESVQSDNSPEVSQSVVKSEEVSGQCQELESSTDDSSSEV